jgi:hypothetical protein
MIAKQVELNKLKEFDTYEEVEDLGQDRISTTWVLWNKGSEVRARLVARGFEDKQAFPKDSPTIGKSAMRIILSLAVNMGWKIKTTDIKSAFLQGKPINREVFLRPPEEAQVQSGYIWKLKHCIYGLNDAARHFYQSVVDTLKKVGCRQSTLDPALFYKTDRGNLVGVVACHVDDFLHAGCEQFDSEVMEKFVSRFLAGKMGGANFKYVGFDVLQDLDSIVMDHTEYMTQIDRGEFIDPGRAHNKKDTLTQKEQTLFRQLVGRLNWAVQGSRPDLSYEMTELSTKLKQGTVEDLIRVIKCVGRMKSEVSMIKFPVLGPYSDRKIVVFTDAALANLEGSGSMGAHVIFMADSAGRACPLSWKANKIKRVVRSTLSAEMLSLQEGVEDAIYLRAIVTELLQKDPKSLPIVAYVDNQSVVQAIGSTKQVDDKRLRVDIASIKECLAKHDIDSVRWLDGSRQLADCMTKRGASGYKLRQAIMEGQLFV